MLNDCFLASKEFPDIIVYFLLVVYIVFIMPKYLELKEKRIVNRKERTIKRKEQAPLL